VVVDLLVVSKFLDDYEPTNVDSYRKQVMIGDELVMLDIVDTAGHYTPVLRQHYLRHADGYLCVFSLSEPETLQDIIDLRYILIDSCLFMRPRNTLPYSYELLYISEM